MFLKIPSTESSESCQPQRISNQQIVLVCNVGRQSDFLHIKARGAPRGPSSKFYMLHPISEFACQRIVYWVRRMHLKQTSMCKGHCDCVEQHFSGRSYSPSHYRYCKSPYSFCVQNLQTPCLAISYLPLSASSDND